MLIKIHKEPLTFLYLHHLILLLLFIFLKHNLIFIYKYYLLYFNSNKILVYSSLQFDNNSSTIYKPFNNTINYLFALYIIF